MELRTQILTAAQWEQETEQLTGFLQANGKHELTVSYGWGCDLDIDELYQMQVIPISGLQDLIAQSIQSRIFVFGESDLYIHSQDKEIEFVLCHECDIHLTADKTELAQEVAAGWIARGFTYTEIIPRQQSA